MRNLKDKQAEWDSSCWCVCRGPAGAAFPSTLPGLPRVILFLFPNLIAAARGQMRVSRSKKYPRKEKKKSRGWIFQNGLNLRAKLEWKSKPNNSRYINFKKTASLKLAASTHLPSCLPNSRRFHSIPSSNLSPSLSSQILSLFLAFPFCPSFPPQKFVSGRFYCRY